MTEELELFKTQLLAEVQSLLLAGSEKISAMPDATIPLVGTELVPLVQSGLNVKTPISSISSFISMGFVTVGTGSGFDYSTVQLAQAAGKTKIIICTDITETVGFTFSGFLNIVNSPGITLTINDIQWVANAGFGAIYISNFENSLATINWTSTTNKSFIDLTALTASPSSTMDGIYLIRNSSAPSVSAPFISFPPPSSGIFLLTINGAIINFMNGSSGSAWNLNYANIDTFVSIGSNSTPESGLIVKGGSINNLFVFGDTNSSSVIWDLTNVTVSNIISESPTSAGTYNFTNCSLTSIDALIAHPTVNITNGTAKSYFPNTNLPSINFENGDGILTNRTLQWAAGYMSNSLSVAVPLVGSPLPGTVWALASTNDQYNPVALNPKRIAKNGIQITATPPSTPTDFQSFTISGNTASSLGDIINYESICDISYNSGVGDTIDFYFAGNLVYTFTASNVGSLQSTACVEFKVEYFNNNQANWVIKVIQGPHTETQNGFLSLLNWTTSQIIKTVGTHLSGAGFFQSKFASVYLQ